MKLGVGSFHDLGLGTLIAVGVIRHRSIAITVTQRPHKYCLEGLILIVVMHGMMKYNKDNEQVLMIFWGVMNG